MQKALRGAIILCLCLFAFTGCQDARTANAQILALNAGLDIGQTHRILLTVQLPQISQSGSQSGSSDIEPPKQADQELVQNGYVLTQVEGDSIADCLAVLSAALPREVTFLHIRGLYFSESFSKSGALYETLSLLLQSRLIRPGATGFLCLGKAEDVLKAIGPSLGTRLSKSQDSRFQELQAMSLVPYASLAAIGSRMQSHGQDALAVLAAVNNKNALSAPLSGGSQPSDYLVGELPYNSVSPVSYYGAAVFDGTQPGMYLTGYETQLLNLCLGDFEQGTLKARDTSATHAIALKRGKAPRIRVDLREEAPVVSVELFLEGSAYADSLLVDRALLENRVRAQLLEDVTDLLLRLQQAGCDPLNIEGKARMHALTNSAWQRIRWDERYPKACFQVTVNFTLRKNAASIS